MAIHDEHEMTTDASPEADASGRSDASHEADASAAAGAAGTPRAAGAGGIRGAAEGVERSHADVEEPAVDVTPRAAQVERRARAMGRRAPLVAGVSAVVIAALLGWLIVLRTGSVFEVDEEWAEEVLSLRGPIGDLFGYGLNSLGGGIVGVFVVPIGIAIVLLICRRPWGALYFILASAASAGVVQLLKHLFGRARPEDIIVVSDLGSFPSGHVANAATIAVAIGVIAPRTAVWVWGAIYTVLMAISRTYLGAHWFTDTIGGLLVGAGVALLVWAIFAAPLERERLAWTARRAKINAANAQAHVTPPARSR